MADQSSESSKVWRCSDKSLFWARIGFPALCLAGGGFVLAGLIGATKLDVGLGFGGILLVFAAAIHRFALYPRLEATPSDLIVRNPLSTKRIPWDKVKKLSPGYGGIQIERHGDSRVTVWCVQKTNWDMARGNRTRADDVIEEIAAYGSGETRRPQIEFVESEKEQAMTKKSARTAVIIGSVGLAIYMILQIARDSS